MGMTMTQKILAAHAGRDSVKAGEFIICRLDRILGNDVTTPVAVDVFNRITDRGIKNPDQVIVVMDHFMPAKDIVTANLAKKTRAFCEGAGIDNYYEVGRAGIEHALLPEQGLVKAGDVIIGADSHTCTYGALGAFSTGIGSTDMAAAMATGCAWLRVPKAIRVNLTGKKGPWVSGKDVILHLIGIIGVDGATYQSLEFSGEGLCDLSMDDRLTIANMAIEAGAKNGIFPVDEVTREYMRDHKAPDWIEYSADPDAEYARTIEIDLAQVPLTVAKPHLPENTVPVDALSGTPIQQVVIGSCTNGRISDLRQAAAVMAGRTIKKNLRCIVIPATQEIYKQAIQEKLAEIFIDFGAVFSMPTCGPCLGGYLGILGADESCVSTTNRNFIGRMGAKTSKVYLANPAVAAASAVTGTITNPEHLAPVENRGGNYGESISLRG